MGLEVRVVWASCVFLGKVAIGASLEDRRGGRLWVHFLLPSDSNYSSRRRSVTWRG